MLRKQESPSEIIEVGSPKFDHTYLKYNSAVCATVVVFLQGIKRAILLNRQTTTIWHHVAFELWAIHLKSPWILIPKAGMEAKAVDIIHVFYLQV